ncbi:uncharacterized protein LOC125830957 [Solanum verrucosum]|uniref:uncharacterized protein LOC125830957 n=1 Tax=Solanum verrucosum TaxID=315347 RepID=UPI0020D1097A|nr:uncharacterized protein LOC125830957 [Solanum verrucosum]
MAAPPSLEEGQSTTRPPCFNGQFYGWWKTRMNDYINAEDTELCDVVLDGPYIPTKEVVDGELTKVITKTRREYNEDNMKKIEKNYKAKKLPVCGIGPNEYNKISACKTTKEIWDCLKTNHEGTTQVKESKEGETIHEMNTRFTSITNDLRCLDEPIHLSKQVRKILRVLPKSWESKVNAITEARDLKVLTMDDLIGNLQAYELNRQQGSTVKEGKKEKSVALKMSLNDGSEEEDEMTYLTKRRNQVLDHARRKAHADQVVKKALAVWGNGSSESNEEEDSHEDVSVMAIKDDETVFNSIFSLMAKSDDEENQDEVTHFDLKSDLDTLSIKRLRKLVAVLIDLVDELTTENMMISKKLSLCEDENAALNSQMSEMSVRTSKIETESMQPSEEPGTSGVGNGNSVALWSN